VRLSDADGAIADAVRDGGNIIVQQCTAGVDDVSDVAIAFVRVRGEQRLGQRGYNDGRAVQVEQQCAQAVRAHRPDAVGDDQPARGRLDR
jgi:hypothetical protein